jgi:hypothetical protein
LVSRPADLAVHAAEEIAAEEAAGVAGLFLWASDRAELVDGRRRLRVGAEWPRSAQPSIAAFCRRPSCRRQAARGDFGDAVAALELEGRSERSSRSSLSHRFIVKRWPLVLQLVRAAA